MALILDTSVLIAALDIADPDHGRCAQLIGGAGENLIVPALVLPELDRWCAERLTVDVGLAFLEDVLTGAYTVEAPTQTDLERAFALQSVYRDLQVRLVDGSVLATVERLGELKLATLDHRRFAAMRPTHVEALKLLPV